MQKDKHIPVDESTHVQAKAQAKKSGRTLKGYIKYLLNKDKNNQVDKMEMEDNDSKL